MADYFTRFSVVLPLPNEAAQKYALDLAKNASRIQQGEESPADFPPSLAEVIEEWHFETDAEGGDGKWGLWLHSDYGGIEAVCAFIQHLLQKFDPPSRVAFEWSYDCSQPRVDAYGGGAALITAKEIKTMNTSGWLRSQTT
jgi:hypothetical protein